MKKAIAIFLLLVSVAGIAQEAAVNTDFGLKLKEQDHSKTLVFLTGAGFYILGATGLNKTDQQQGDTFQNYSALAFGAGMMLTSFSFDIHDKRQKRVNLNP